jgi:hypothetical protein
MRVIKMRFFKRFLLAILAMPGLSLAVGLNNPPAPLSGEALGMGEAVAADGNVYNGTAFNPALLANAPYLGEIGLGFNASNSIFGISDYLSSSSNSGSSSSLPAKTVGLGAGFNIALKFDDHWGFQIYYNSHVLLQLAAPVTIETITGPAYFDTVAMVTYNIAPLEDETPLTVGVNLKVVDHRVGIINTSGSPGDLSGFQNQLDKAFNQDTFRWGLDLGLLYDFPEEHVAFGLSALDLLHSAGTIDNNVGDALYGVNLDPAPVVVKFGVSWHPIKPFVLNADLDDLLSSTSYYSGQSFGNHVKLGLSYDLLGILIIRGGYSNGNPSFGGGVPFLGINYAYAVDDVNQIYTHYLIFKADM